METLLLMNVSDFLKRKAWYFIKRRLNIESDEYYLIF